MLSMGKLERNIQLYTLSFNLVRPYIDQLEVHASRNEVSVRLHHAIRREIAAGQVDAVKVAENAVRSVQENYTKTAGGDLPPWLPRNEHGA